LTSERGLDFKIRQSQSKIPVCWQADRDLSNDLFTPPALVAAQVGFFVFTTEHPETT
jgi:hypothetical protein